MRHLRLLPLLLSLTAFAQTYVPKQIKVQGIEAADQPEVLRVLALKPGTPLNKTDIESALQRLADTGSFSDLSYTVDANTLTFILKPAEGSQAVPVRFSNFVWWQSDELTTLIEARVPLFHGKLPVTGKLTDDVSQALTALLAEKGIAHAKIITGTSALGGPGIVLSIAEPPVVLGDIKLEGAAAPVQQQLAVVASKLAGRDFDIAETPKTIRDNVADTHINAGFLDAKVDAPVFTPPHKDMLSYAVDAAVAVHPGEMYRIASLDLQPPLPVTAADAEKATSLHIGDPAGAMNLRIAEGKLTRAYEAQGYLEVHVQAVSTPNAATHTVTDHFAISPGALDTFAAVDASALPYDLRQQFTAEFHAKPGTPAGTALTTDIFRALRAIGANNSVRVNQRLNRRDHTVELVLVPATTHNQ